MSRDAATRRSKLAPSKTATAAESAANREQFLQFVAGTHPNADHPMSLAGAARAIDVHPHTVRRWRKDYPDFEEALQAAMDDGTDLLEDEAMRRAMRGVSEPVYQGGDLVGHKQVYSDTLMQAMLGGRRPEKFGKNTNIIANQQNNIEAPPTRELAKALMLVMEEQKASKP